MTCRFWFKSPPPFRCFWSRCSCLILADCGDISLLTSGDCALGPTLRLVIEQTASKAELLHVFALRDKIPLLRPNLQPDVQSSALSEHLSTEPPLIYKADRMLVNQRQDTVSLHPFIQYKVILQKLPIYLTAFITSDQYIRSDHTVGWFQRLRKAKLSQTPSESCECFK